MQDHTPDGGAWRRRAKTILHAIAFVATLLAGVGRQHDALYELEALPGPPKNRVLRALASFAMQDWLVASYLFVLLSSALLSRGQTEELSEKSTDILGTGHHSAANVVALVLLVCVLLGDGPRRRMAIACVLVDTVIFFACMLVARGQVEKWRFAADVLYRIGLIGVVVGSVLQLHLILPTVSTRIVDADLYGIDMAVFGFEPAQSWDRYVTPRRTEWFSFFYYSYFFILCAYLLPMALLETRIRILSELSAGLLFVVCVGHCLYLAVPGLGPHVYLRGELHNELSGGFWWPLVRSAVDSVGGMDGSSRTDIFPSLHTGCPTFLTLFTFRHRAHRPYRYVWPVTAFFTSQIILATMYLRWHYLIDVVAGLALAVLAFVGARAMVPGRQRVFRSPGHSSARGFPPARG